MFFLFFGDILWLKMVFWMKNVYVIDYRNENEFKLKEKGVRKCNMLAYKKLIFDYYPLLREGKFQGELIFDDIKSNVKKYELILPTDEIFMKLYGNITLYYTVYFEKKTIILETLTPEDILEEAGNNELTAYKGILVSKSHKELDIFRINLLNSLSRDNNF